MSSQGPKEEAEGDSLPREAEGSEAMGGRRDHKPRKDRAGFSLEPVEGPALPAAQGTVWTLASGPGRELVLVVLSH